MPLEDTLAEKKDVLVVNFAKLFAQLRLLLFKLNPEMMAQGEQQDMTSTWLNVFIVD